MIRKFTVIAAVMAASVALAAESEQEFSEQGQGAIGWTAAQIGLFSPIAYPWGDDWDLYGIDADLFLAENVNVQGVELSLGATHTRGTLKGIAASLFCNWNDDEVYGARVALLGINYAVGDVYGVDWGFFGMRKNMWGLDCNFLGSHQDTFRGIQFGGLCNVAYQELRGLDLSFGLNFSCDMKGAQVGGVNFAHSFKGCQIGLFNIAEECPNGIQIGLVNIIMDNTVKVLPLVNWYFK